MVGAMAETQRRPVPRNDGAKLQTALAFLTFARESVLKKTEGLSEEQLRRVLVGTGTTLLGLIQHLTVAERHWFGYHVAGVEPESGVGLPHGGAGRRGTGRCSDDYGRRASERRDDPRAGHPEAPGAPAGRRAGLTVRWVLAHMTSETARQPRHADILREQIDGVTGR